LVLAFLRYRDKPLPASPKGRRKKGRSSRVVPLWGNGKGADGAFNRVP